MEFEQRLQRAIQRGEQTRSSRDEARQAERLSSAELRDLYSQARLQLSEHIESCLRKLADHFPGYRYDSILGDTGWGSRITRDDLQLARGQSPSNQYSRLELTITPLGSQPIIELVAKGTIRNREVLSRRHYQQLEQVDTQSFSELIDLWVLEYAEQYAAT
ncbi:MAG: hypothetical protein ACK5Q5_11290 [Planctomycetaceae bacterium]